MDQKKTICTRRSKSVTGFFEVMNSFLRPVFQNWYYGPFLIPCSDVSLKLGQKKPKFVYWLLLVKNGQKP